MTQARQTGVRVFGDGQVSNERVKPLNGLFPPLAPAGRRSAFFRPFSPRCRYLVLLPPLRSAPPLRPQLG
jgi:hypothetical protein